MSQQRNDLFYHFKNCDLEALEHAGSELARWQRGVNWWIGDLARYAEARFPDTWNQVFPEWISPGLVARCAAVAKAYPNEEDRNPLASWAVHMQHANKPDRIALVQASVDAGRTSDEEREHRKQSNQSGSRWLLAVDVNYYINEFFHAGAEEDAAVSLAESLTSLTRRMMDDPKLKKKLTDVVCCFDHHENHRKLLTKDWEHKYKGNRPEKRPELVQQIRILPDVLKKHNFRCVSVPGMESDDVMASYAKQFDGHVTIMSTDKDLLQCLSDKCSILHRAKPEYNEHTGSKVYNYDIVLLSHHLENTGLTDDDGKYIEGTGIPPEKWPECQALMGDNADNIKGVDGVGPVKAYDFIRRFGSVDAVIENAKKEAEQIKNGTYEGKNGKNDIKIRNGLIEFEQFSEVTLELVTLRNDLNVPSDTRI